MQLLVCIFMYNWQLSDLLSIKLKNNHSYFQSQHSSFQRCCWWFGMLRNRVKAQSRGNLLNRSGPRTDPWRMPYLNEELKVWSLEARNWNLDLCAVHTCNSYHLSFSTFVIKVSHILHFIKCLVGSLCHSLSLSLHLSLSVFEDTADCRQVCRHSWCLVISLLLFHLCYCFPLLTFQTNLVWQTDHRCPLDSSPLSLTADLLFLVSSQIPMSSIFFALLLLLFFLTFHLSFMLM